MLEGSSEFSHSLDPKQTLLRQWTASPETFEMSLAEPGNIFFPEAFVTPSKRGWATNELASYGEDAVPLLRAILDGSAVNGNRVPYRRLGTPVDCALVTIRMLGQTARSLRELVQAEVVAGHPYAEDALRALG